MSFLAYLEKLSQLSKILLGVVLVGITGVVDILTGYELAFSLFYVIPVSYTTWYIGRRYGIIMSLFSAMIWLWADVASGHFYSQPIIPIWNAMIRFAFFIIIALLLSALKKTLEHEKELARTDYLTGAVNSRLFYELVEMEIERLQRNEHPFTLVYFDLDNFKSVNDQFGHLAGDQVLRTVVSYARDHLRKIDVIARLGGDEFALLLPETAHESALIVIEKLQSGFLEEMRQRNWSITFSVGVLTCKAAPSGPDELIKIADGLMYSAKHSGKNAIKYSDYESRSM
jgi:diguanylate cyclase (GGDEF)-like protein